MRSIKAGIMPFRMGYGAAKPLTEAEGGFYLSVVEALTGLPVLEIQKYPIPAIAIESDTLNTRPQMMYEAFFAAADALTAEAEVIIADLDIYTKADLRGTALLHIASAVVSALEKMQIQSSKTELFVLLMPAFHSGGNAFFKLIDSSIQSGKLIVISDDGNYIAQNRPLAHFSREQYRLKLSLVRGEPIELLARKMIRQHGHFKRERAGRHVECVRTFFDGQLCNQEIRMLTANYLQRKYAENRIPDIVYHYTISDWLQGPLLRLASELKIGCFSFEEIFAYDRKPDSWQGATPTLVVPLVDSGNTVRDVINKMRRKFSIQQINVLTILSTSGEQDVLGSCELASGIPIDYFLKVSRKRYVKDVEQCPMCDLGIPYTEEGTEPAFMLSAFDFWAMVDLVGLKGEQDIPRNRESLGKVPDFPAMLDSNGAWIAKKIGDSLLQVLEGKLNDVVVICPDQSGSQILTEYLRVVSGVSVIRIPTEVINDFRSDPNVDSLRTAWAKKRPAWFMELSSSPVSEVVVMDEFTVSCGTRWSIT